MVNWRFIANENNLADYNMAIDECLFALKSNNKSLSPVLRVYSWSLPLISIGYFQKYSDFANRKLPVIRRITGGLSVEHGKDISYSLIASKDEWPYINNQEKTYKLIHNAILKTLNDLSIDAEFCEKSIFQKKRKDSVCVNNIFPYDIHLNGRKIVGSCQRKRGSAFLVQGSIHVEKLITNYREFSKCLMDNFKDILKTKIFSSELNNEEVSLSGDLAKTKYSSDSWNKKY
ncbi:MAG: hypothetical protein NT145_00825 [Elusimicrobia bacterium]|nr:hypothetical protein [Elusimicrobiota bacterium]